MLAVFLVMAWMDRERFKSDVLRLAFLLGLCSAIGVYLIVTAPLISKDGVFYIEQAKLLDQDPLGVCRRYPPGYPFLLWAGHEVASLFVQGDPPMLWVYSAQGVTLLCRVLSLVPLYFLGKLLVGGANSFWALFVLVILPYPAFFGSDVLREWPYVLFLSTGVLLLYWGLTTRRWWVLALVGLDAGLGYLIRPECAQLLIYAACGLLVQLEARRPQIKNQDGGIQVFPDGLHPFDLYTVTFAVISMVGAFAVPVALYVYASGSIIPHQFRPPVFNMPPVISAVGPEAAADNPLEFEVRQGELLELPIQASDPDGDALSFSLAGVPQASRPMYAFRSATTGAGLWTISEQEKDSLLIHHPELWNCEGIAWYAYAGPDVRPGLRPVYRFWSPEQQRHFYTMSDAEKEAIVTESAAGSWTYEGAVFYAFGEEDHPADATAVYRFWDQTRGYSWATIAPSEPNAQKDTIAWYVHPAAAPPAGAGIEGGVFRWRPGAGRQGEHQMNIIVADGKLPCCQLITIRVTGEGSEKSEVSSWKGDEGNVKWEEAAVGAALQTSHCKLQASLSLLDLAGAANDVAGGIGENFMVIPALLWILGLYRYREGREGTLEWVLIPAIVIVNLGLLLGRGVWIGNSSDRRHSVALISLTICFLPIGVDVAARMLSRIYAFRGRLASLGAEGRPLWFYLLMVGGIVLCTPKLILTPLRADKVGLRTAGEWLRQNTRTDAVVADPDGRIGFYAQRQGLHYERYPDSRKADYVVRIEGSNPMQAPQDWARMHSASLGPRDDRMVIIYRTTRAKE